MAKANLTTFVKRIRDIMRNDAGVNGDAQRIEQLAWMLFLKVYDAKESDWELDDGYTSVIPGVCRWQNWAHDDGHGTAMTGDRLLAFVDGVLFPVLKGKDVTLQDGTELRGIQITPQTPLKQSIVQTVFMNANQYMKDGVLLRQVLTAIDEIDLTDNGEIHAFGEIYETILKEIQSAGSAGEYYTPRAVTDFMVEAVRPQIGEKMADFACGTGGFLTGWLKALRQKTDRTTEEQNAIDTSVYGIEKKQFPYILCVTNLLLHDVELPQIYHDNALLKDVLNYTEKDRFHVILMNPPYGGAETAAVKSHFPGDIASSETADLFMAVILYRLKQDGRAAVVLPDGFLFGTDGAKLALKKKLLAECNLHTIVRLPASVFAPYTSITTNLLFFDKTHPTKETWFYRLDMPAGYKHFSKTKPMTLAHFDPVRAWWVNREEIEIDGFPKAKRYTADELVRGGYNLDLCGFPHAEEEILPPHECIARYQAERATLNATIEEALAEVLSLLDSPCEGDTP